MQLNEFVKLQKPGTMMHINATTSYFMVVTPEEFEREARRVEAKNNLYYTNQLATCTEALERALKKELKIGEEETVENFVNRVTNHISHIKDYQYGINKSSVYLNQFIPIKDRKVLDSYDRISEDGIVVQVTGNEVGRYWDRKEWEDDHAR